MAVVGDSTSIRNKFYAALSRRKSQTLENAINDFVAIVKCRNGYWSRFKNFIKYWNIYWLFIHIHQYIVPLLTRITAYICSILVSSSCIFSTSYNYNNISVFLSLVRSMKKPHIEKKLCSSWKRNNNWVQNSFNLYQMYYCCHKPTSKLVYSLRCFFIALAITHNILLSISYHNLHCWLKTDAIIKFTVSSLPCSLRTQTHKHFKRLQYYVETLSITRYHTTRWSFILCISHRFKFSLFHVYFLSSQHNKLINGIIW